MSERIYLEETQNATFQAIIGPNGVYDQCVSEAVSCIVYRKIDPDIPEPSYGISISGTPGPEYTVQLNLGPICNENLDCINSAFEPHQGPMFSEDGEFLGINDRALNNTLDGILKDRFHLDLPLNECQLPEKGGAWCVPWNSGEKLVSDFIKMVDKSSITITLPKDNEFLNTAISLFPVAIAITLFMVAASYIGNKAGQPVSSALDWTTARKNAASEALKKGSETLSRVTSFFGRGK